VRKDVWSLQERSSVQGRDGRWKDVPLEGRAAGRTCRCKDEPLQGRAACKDVPLQGRHGRCRNA